jgi:hypothetical protein
MNVYLTRYSIPLLRWTLGLVVILESCRFVFSGSAAHFLAKAGLPWWIRPVLGGAEVVAAILFIVPVTSLIGGYALLVIFGMAAIVHFLHGQFGVEGLVLYAVAVLVCIAYKKTRTDEALNDGT